MQLEWIDQCQGRGSIIVIVRTIVVVAVIVVVRTAIVATITIVAVKVAARARRRGLFDGGRIECQVSKSS